MNRPPLRKLLKQTLRSLLPVFLLLTAIAQAGPDLFRGQVDTENRFSAVVLLEQEKGSCTATWISPQVLLTAAHCVCGKKSFKIRGFKSATFESRVHPDYVPSRCHEVQTADVALLRVQQAQAESPPVIPVNLSTQLPAGYPVVLVGYGNYQIYGQWDAQRRWAQTRLWGNGPLLIPGVTGLLGDGGQRYTTLAFVDYKQEARQERSSAPTAGTPAILSGDSGGPMLIFTSRSATRSTSRSESHPESHPESESDGALVPQVVGVASYVSRDYRSYAGGAVVGWYLSNFVRLDQLAISSWIDQTLREWSD